jgi:hypothetical protein
VNYLSPEIRNPAWTSDEEALLATKVAVYGRRWNQIACFFEGRTAINIKNHWNYLSKRRPEAPEEDSVDDPIERLFDTISKEAEQMFPLQLSAPDHFQ